MILRRVAPVPAYRRLADSAQRFVDELFWHRGVTRIEPIPIVARKKASPRPKRRKLEPHLGRWIDISV